MRARTRRDECVRKCICLRLPRGRSCATGCWMCLVLQDVFELVRYDIHCHGVRPTSEVRHIQLDGVMRRRALDRSLGEGEKIGILRHRVEKREANDTWTEAARTAVCRNKT